MNKFSALFVLVLFAFYCQAQTPNFHWGAGWGGINFDPALSVATDPLGNVISVGSFLGSADMDPGPGVYTVGARGANDIFIHKMDATGKLLWAKGIGDVGIDVATSVAVDSLGNIYLTGYYERLVDFDPAIRGVYRLRSQGASDFFILKLNASGDFVWAKSIGSASWDWGQNLKLDGHGHLYLTGYHSGQTDFDPDSLATLMLNTAGQSDAFIMKMDTAGNLIWAKAYGGPSYDFGWDFDIDASENVCLAGYFEGTADFDPGPGVFNLSSKGGRDLYAMKLDSSGNFKWARSTGGTLNDRAQACSVDPWGNVYVSGYFENTVDLDPGPDTIIKTSNGARDIFVIKLDSLGNTLKAYSAGGFLHDEAKTSVCDASGNFYLSGYFKDSVDFDFGPSVFKLPNSLFQDAFILILDTAGNLNWAGSLGGPEDETGHQLYLDSKQNLYLAGSFEARADLDPTPGFSYAQTRGRTDAFVTKLIPCNFSDTNVVVHSCGPYLSPDGRTLISNGEYVSIIKNQTGCDSIIRLSLFVHEIERDSTTLQVCDSFLLPSGSRWIYSGGWFGDTLKSVYGCDSLLSIFIQMNRSTTSMHSDTACRSYISPSGKRILRSALFTDTIKTFQNCDSLIRLDIYVRHPDTSVRQNTNILKANSVNASFQWLDCSASYAPLVGEDSAVFQPIKNGLYAVEINQEGCIDTSSCYRINSIGWETPLDSRLYEIQRESSVLNLKILDPSVKSARLLDSRGRNIQSYEVSASNSMLHFGEQSAGIYILQIEANGVLINRKLLFLP